MSEGAALRVLVVEDSVADAKLVVHELRRRWPDVQHERVQDAAEFAAALEGQRWDVVICDWSMPTFSASLAMNLVKSAGLDLPFVIVSGTIGEETAVEAMREGAHDYVLKDRLARLVPAVERELKDARERAGRRKAEEALRESENRFRRLDESGIVGIVVADIEGAVIEANEAFARMLGYTREELEGGKATRKQLTPPEWAEADQRAMDLVEKTGSAPAREKEYFAKNGERVPVLIGVALLDHPRCIAFIADLSERKRAERALRESDEQLRQAQKMEAVGRLAGGVAHDFNNLLSVVLSYAELLALDMDPKDPARDDVEEIRRAGRRAADLTRQLLMFSRQQIVEPTVLDLNELIGGMTKMLNRLLGEDIEFSVRTSADLAPVRVDPGSVEQVIMNLAVNARDAMPTGGTLTVETANVMLDEAYARAHPGAHAGPHVMLAVADTGVGIAKEMQARIFEPFFTTKEKGKGTGLGLSTAFGIVHQSGGVIDVDSEPARGATFKVYFPRFGGTAARVQTSEAPSRLDGTETILLVEDEEQVRAVAADILRRRGYTVLDTRGAEEALSLAAQHPGAIHLVVTDVVMPKMSGPELARRIGAVRPAAKVLWMSGYTDDTMVHHGVEGLGAPFLAKPITPDTLARKVREVLDAPAQPTNDPRTR